MLIDYIISLKYSMPVGYEDMININDPLNYFEEEEQDPSSDGDHDDH